jgi:hypothetical protein
MSNVPKVERLFWLVCTTAHIIACSGQPGAGGSSNASGGYASDAATATGGQGGANAGTGGSTCTVIVPSTFACGPSLSCSSAEFCVSKIGGVVGSTTSYSCQTFTGSCPACDWLCPVHAPGNPGPECAGYSVCSCGESSSGRFLSCAGA